MSANSTGLAVLVQLYKEAYDAKARITNATVAVELCEIIQSCQEELWQLLEAPLSELATKWLWRECGYEVRGSETQRAALSGTTGRSLTTAMALNLFYHVLDRIPRLKQKVSEEKNVLGLLIELARRGAETEDRKVYRRGPRRSYRQSPKKGDGHSTNDQTETSDEVSRPGMCNFYDDALSHVSDPAFDDFDDRIVERLYSQQGLEAVYAFMRSHATPHERRLFELRFGQDELLPHAAIAAALGPRYTGNAVRVALHRLQKKLQAMAKEHHMLNHDDEGG